MHPSVIPASFALQKRPTRFQRVQISDILNLQRRPQRIGPSSGARNLKLVVKVFAVRNRDWKTLQLGVDLKDRQSSGCRECPGHTWQTTFPPILYPLAPKWRKSADKSLWQPSCSHSNTIYEIELQKTIVLRMQPQHEATYYNAICRDWVAKHNRTTHNGVGNCSSKTGSRRQSEKKTILKHFLKGFLEGKSLAPKWRKSADKSLWQPSCSDSNTIYAIELQRTIGLNYQCSHGTKQPWHSHYNAICRDWVAKHNRTTHNGVGNSSSKTGSRRQSGKKNDFESTF